MARPDRSAVAVVAVIAVIVLAGCVAPRARSVVDGRDPDGTRPSPSVDVLGWEGGYWYDDPIDVDLRDGLDETEARRFVARTMARLEHIRRREFTREVGVRVSTREAEAERMDRIAGTRVQSPEQRRFWNQYYEALFLVDEPSDAVEAMGGQGSGFFVAYYLFDSDEIVLVTRGNGRLPVGELTVAHELAHALQDEYRGDFETRWNHTDERAAVRATVEGDPTYVEHLYRERCRRDWECVSRPPKSDDSSDGSPKRSDPHRGLRLMSRHPYVDGATLVRDLYVEGRNGTDGWAAVDAMYRRPPTSSEQVIHPDRYPNETPQNPPIRRQSSGEWTYSDWNVAGELGLFAMFWYQDVEYGIPVVDSENLYAGDDASYDRRNYTSVPSEGWRGDRISFFTDGERNGYVWELTWDTRRDAREFKDAYLRVLRGHGARRVAPGTWDIDDGGYADAFHVTIQGRNVTVVNGPTVEDLDDIGTGSARVAG
jgi:hypothetical protein